MPSIDDIDDKVDGKSSVIKSEMTDHFRSFLMILLGVWKLDFLVLTRNLARLCPLPAMTMLIRVLLLVRMFLTALFQLPPPHR